MVQLFERKSSELISHISHKSGILIYGRTTSAQVTFVF
jgi:hypothetical protein